MAPWIPAFAGMTRVKLALWRLAPVGGALLDHLVGKVEHARWDSEAERVSGLEVDDQRVFRRLLNGEVGGTGAPEDAVDIGCRLRVQVDRSNM